jgi:DNA helicase-2/ATP-dependent DNA helicase PcrA
MEHVRDSPRKIAVITYTNAAVYEIESRLRIYGCSEDLDSCDVSTIHSFCLNNLLRRFAWRCPDYANGFKLLPSDSEDHQRIVVEVCTEHGLNRTAAEQFGQLNRTAAGEPILNTDSPITREAAHAFWGKLRHEGFVDFATIIYLTYRLITQYPSLARALSCRYQWVLVDEFQDTTELQVEILKRIHDAAESRFFLVGDPHQSIFGFAGARPALSEEFAAHIRARRDFQLSQNWRSNPEIVAHAEMLRPRTIPMISSGEAAQFSCAPVYVHSATPYQAIEDYFLPALEELNIDIGKAAILAPWWVTLIGVGRQLRALGVPIIGPGSRPYRASNVFARMAEYCCEYLERRNPVLIRNLQRELQRVTAEASGQSGMDAFTHGGRTTIFRLLAIGAELRGQSDSAERWLTEASSRFTQQLIHDGFLPLSAVGLLTDSTSAMCEQMRRANVDLANLTISDLGLFAATDRSMQMLTIHAAKGLEWEAVALIGMNEGQIPNFRATTAEQIDEHRRLFYVGISRAKKFLLYVSDQSNVRNRPSSFLDELRLN